LINLQATIGIGNRAVHQLMDHNAGFDFGKIRIQPKLKASHPEDMYEQEADRVAEQVNENVSK
jgi:hypothetical protein